MTNDLARRVFEHKEKFIEGFTKKYNLNQLVYFEEYNDIYEVYNRERKLKFWKRVWKIDLIEKSNPEWRDLYEDVI